MQSWPPAAHSQRRRADELLLVVAGLDRAGVAVELGPRRAGVPAPVQGRRRGAYPREHHRAPAAGLGGGEEGDRGLHVRLHEADVQGQQRHLQRAPREPAQRQAGLLHIEAIVLFESTEVGSPALFHAIIPWKVHIACNSQNSVGSET
jgi:hypothetical protein